MDTKPTRLQGYRKGQNGHMQVEIERIRRMLADKDVPCPSCEHNLRGVQGDRCPECGRDLYEPGIFERGNHPKRSFWKDVESAIKTIAVVVLCLFVLFFLTCAYGIANPGSLGGGGVFGFW